MGRRSYKDIAEEMGITIEELKEMRKANKDISGNKTNITDKREIIQEEDKDDNSIYLYSVSAKNEKKLISKLSNPISKEEVRSIVNARYAAQSARIATMNRIRAIKAYYSESNPLSELSMEIMENDLNFSLKPREVYFDKIIKNLVESTPVGRWLLSIIGIGPTIAAALIGYLDIERSKYPSAFISYCGQNDQNRPWLGVEKSRALVNKCLSRAEFKEIPKEVIDTEYEVPDYHNKVSVFVDDMKVYNINGHKSVCMYNYDPNIWINHDVPESEWVSIYEFFESIESDTEHIMSGEIDIKDGYIVNDDLSVKYFNRGDILYDNVYGTYYVCIKSGERTDSKRIDEDVINTISAESQWSLSHFESCKDSKGFYNKDQVIKKCAVVPYNRFLKTLCFKIGESFVKVSNNPNSLYGSLYKERKAIETRKNENGEFADKAKALLSSMNFTDPATIATLESGKLTKKHIDMRARRVAVKVFLVHLFQEMYWERYDTAPAEYYAIGIMGHRDIIKPEVPFKSCRNSKDIERLKNNLPIDNRSNGVKMSFTPEELKKISAEHGVHFDEAINIDVE